MTQNTRDIEKNASDALREVQNTLRAIESMKADCDGYVYEQLLKIEALLEKK